MALFPVAVRDERKRLSPVVGISLEDHSNRLRFVRGRLLERLTGMTMDNYRRTRTLPDYDVTPEWVLRGLAQHEALHRGQILILKNRAAL